MRGYFIVTPFFNHFVLGLRSSIELIFDSNEQTYRSRNKKSFFFKTTSPHTSINLLYKPKD